MMSEVMDTILESTRPPVMVLATAVPHMAPNEIGDSRQHDGLARRQDLGGNDGGDGIGRVMKAVDVFKNQRHHDNGQDERHGASGILQDDMGDDVADVAAAVNDLFQQFVKVFQNDDFDGISAGR